MAWEKLREDYTDAVWTGLKKYIEIRNEDNTVSFQDITPYSHRENSFFGAKDANRMNKAMNIIMSMLENGTDLYTAFQEYFAAQQIAFQIYADEYQKNLQSFLSTITNDLNVLTYIQEYTNAVTLTEDSDTVPVGIDDFAANEDVLFVSINGVVCASSGYTIISTGAEACVVLKEARAAGDSFEFRVLKSKIGSAAMNNVFALCDADGTVLTDNGAALVIS